MLNGLKRVPAIRTICLGLAYAEAKALIAERARILGLSACGKC